MLTQAEIAERERIALQNCADFEEIVTEIINAGFAGSNPFFAVYDSDGNFWKMLPREMGVGDILAYVHHRFGELFVSFCRGMRQLTVH